MAITKTPLYKYVTTLGLTYTHSPQDKTLSLFANRYEICLAYDDDEFYCIIEHAGQERAIKVEDTQTIRDIVFIISGYKF